MDFINAQLGIGFSVPIIMLNHALDIRDIGYIIATSGILTPNFDQKTGTLLILACLDSCYKSDILAGSLFTQSGRLGQYISHSSVCF